MPHRSSAAALHLYSCQVCLLKDATSAHMWRCPAGTGSQEDLLLRDQCILVDGTDTIVGSASKRDAHRFDSTQPEGRLHRAFSVFLFDARNRLLLQQRAPGKVRLVTKLLRACSGPAGCCTRHRACSAGGMHTVIRSGPEAAASAQVTFPSVWTNTCCSHPLHGQQPPEVDSPADIASGAVPGVKHAAVRKLGHELGIPPAQLPASGFRCACLLVPKQGLQAIHVGIVSHEVSASRR